MLRKNDNSDALPIPSTMDQYELAAHIREQGVWPIVEMFIKPEAEVMMGLRDGINISGWMPTRGAGFVLFARHTADGDEGVVYVNTDDRAIIASHVSAIPFPVIGIGRTEAKRDAIDQDVESAWRASVAHLLPNAHT